MDKGEITHITQEGPFQIISTQNSNKPQNESFLSFQLSKILDFSTFLLSESCESFKFQAFRKQNFIFQLPTFMIPCFPLSSLGFPTFCFLKAESMKVLSCFHAFYFPSFQPSSFISILTSKQTNQLNDTTYIILRTILGQCFHAFHFPAFRLSTIISILTFEQTNQLNDTTYIKDHFRAVLSCFPLSSFPTLLHYLNPEVRADEPVV